MVQLFQEPQVDFCDLMNFLAGNAPAQGFKDDEETLVILIVQFLVQLFVAAFGLLFLTQAIQRNSGAAHGFHDTLLKTLANGHHFAGGFHLGAQRTLGVYEFVEGPLGQLDHHIVQRRLKAGKRFAGNSVGNFVQSITDCNLGGHAGDGGLGCQGGGTADAGVHLNDRIFKAVRVQGELAVAAALDAHGGNDVQCGRAEHLILFIRQSYCGGDDDGVAGMDAYRVEVFHGAHRDHIAAAVAHHLEFHFFPTSDAAFHQNLGNGTQPQASFADTFQIGAVVADAAAAAAQSKSGAHDDRVADFLGKCQRVLQCIDDFGRNHWLADGFHGIFKHLAIFCFVDRIRVCAQQHYIMFLQEPGFGQLHRKGQARLPAQCGQNAVRLFFFDDALNGFQCQRLDVNMVGHGVVGHNGGGVGIDQNNFQALFLQRTAGLRACIVKLGGLPDNDRTGTNDHNFSQFWIQRHKRFPPRFEMMDDGSRGNTSVNKPLS